MPETPPEVAPDAVATTLLLLPCSATPTACRNDSTLVAPVFSISSRVIICTGSAVSASMRLMLEPVISTRSIGCCATAGEAARTKPNAVPTAIDNEVATPPCAFVLFISPLPENAGIAPVVSAADAAGYLWATRFIPFGYKLISKRGKYAHSRLFIAIRKLGGSVVRCSKHSATGRGVTMGLRQNQGGAIVPNRKTPFLLIPCVLAGACATAGSYDEPYALVEGG